MKTTLKAALLLTAIFPILNIQAFAEEIDDKSIYGSDDRVEYFAAAADMKVLADSVVSLWSAGSLKPEAGKYTLATEKFGDKLNLCPGEKFREQPIGAFCSGSLVGPDLVMTAGHCITDEASCADARMVFGFAVKANGGAAPTTIAAGEVYSCKKIVKRFLGGEPTSGSTSGLGPDYALVQLDRKVTGHKPLPVNRSGSIKKGTKLVVIGHPVGLPLKVAGGSSVRDASPNGYFVTDLDTFGGNSGSPVFNASTKLIEGILVRGDEDFKPAPGGGCTTMATYAQTGGRGEDVTKISALSASIPKRSSEKAWSEEGAEAPVPQAMTIGGVDMQGEIDQRFGVGF